MKLTQKIFLAGIALLTILSFQNCGKNFGNMADELVMASNLFVDMKADEADTILQNYSKSCLLSSDFKFQSINPNSAVTLNGQQFAAKITGDLPSISGNGNLLLKGSKPGFIVDKASSFSGNIALCDVSLNIATGVGKTVTTIYIEGGSLQSIVDFSGNIIINGDRFPENIKNFKGNIVVKTSGGQVLGRKYLK